MALITFADKQAMGTQPSIPEVNKITDSNVNAIKSAVNNSTYYSTTEQVVGTWKNDKPIYRKVFEVSGTMTTGTWTTVATLSGVSTLLNAWFIDNVTTKAVWQDTNVRVNSDNLQYYSSDFAHTYTGLIVEYTKTSDL